MTIYKAFTCNETVNEKINKLQEHYGKKFTRLMCYLVEKEFEKIIKEQEQNVQSM